MKLVLDTNIFCADYRLQGNAFRILFERASRIGVELFVPKIVFDETIGKFKSDFQENSLKLEKANRSIERLLGEKLQTVNYKEVDEIAKNYEGYLFKRFEDNKIQMLPYPQIEHQVIVSRAIIRKKPFKENGDGYRDTLIWFSLLELVKNNQDTIVFVTSNSSDFGKNSLLPDLQNDFRDINISPDLLKIVSSLDEFNNLFVVPDLQILDDMIEKLKNDLVKEFSLRKWIESYLLEDLKWMELEDVFINVEKDHSDVNFKEITEVKNIIVDDVRKLPSGDFLVYATAEVVAEIDIRSTWEQYERFDDVREFWGTDIEPFSWISVDTRESAEVSFSLILKEGSYQVLSSVIDEVNSVRGLQINSDPNNSN